MHARSASGIPRGTHVSNGVSDTTAIFIGALAIVNTNKNKGGNKREIDGLWQRSALGGLVDLLVGFARGDFTFLACG